MSDEAYTGLCLDHFLKLEDRIRKKKRENPRLFGKSNANAVAHRLTKFGVLDLLGFDETMAKKIVVKSGFPLDFEEKLIGDFPHEPELIRRVRHAVLPEKSWNIVSGQGEYYSTVFFTLFDEEKETLRLLRFTTATKHRQGNFGKTWEGTF